MKHELPLSTLGTALQQQSPILHMPHTRHFAASDSDMQSDSVALRRDAMKYAVTILSALRGLHGIPTRGHEQNNCDDYHCSESHSDSMCWHVCQFLVGNAKLIRTLAMGVGAPSSATTCDIAGKTTRPTDLLDEQIGGMGQDSIRSAKTIIVLAHMLALSSEISTAW